jgi:hypothetical protein
VPAAARTATPARTRRFISGTPSSGGRNHPDRRSRGAGCDDLKKAWGRHGNVSAEPDRCGPRGRVRETWPYLGKQARRNKTVSEYRGMARNRLRAGIRPRVDIMLRDDHPTRFVIEPDRLADFQRNLDPRGGTSRRRMGYRQDYHKAGSDCRLASCQKTGRTALPLVAASGGLVEPLIVVSDD